jgi:hypothetical protein
MHVVNQHLKVVMPPFNKSVPKRAANSTPGDRKAGSKSAGHRGFRADAPAAPKQRWTTSDRAKRAEGVRPSSDDRRPDWSPREKPAYQPRGERPAYGDRANRTERPTNDRPSYGDRPARTERPAYGDRSARNERPSNDRPS